MEKGREEEHEEREQDKDDSEKTLGSWEGVRVEGSGA